MSVMRFLAPAAAAGLIWCVVPAAAQTAVRNPAATPGHSRESPQDRPTSADGAWLSRRTRCTSRATPSTSRSSCSGSSASGPTASTGGESVFSNSFGQPSAYVFGGQRLYRWSPWDPLYAEWSAGLLYGYVGEYKNKVPLNYKGFSPGITAGIGWQFTLRSPRDPSARELGPAVLGLG
jgi:hypothetical protein